MSVGTWQQLISGIRNQDAETVREFWVEYGSRLLQLADANLQQQLRARLDAEDVVQSAIRTFLRRMEDGQFEVNDDQALWSLLCAITLNKVRMAARHHLRKRRGVDQEHCFDEQVDSPLRERAPGTEDVAALVELVEQALADARDPQERQVLQLKLEDCSNPEIAQHVGCSERTVRRLLQRSRQRLERMLET